MLPGEEKVFTLSFRSTSAGMYNEEWEILTEPALNDALPVLSLSGISIEDETDMDDLAALDAELEANSHTHLFSELIDDMVD